MSLELVLLVPVLVLLTVFVLWAGRGGRAALTADLAAEEAATVAALCCEEDDAGAADREALVEDVLEARPGLEFLCVGGLRPEAPPDSGIGPDEFVREHWLDFEPGSGVRTGGVGVLGVQFSCETDGAVAPMRGLFPTVTFHGQASEVVIREPPPPDIGFVQTTFSATEGPGAQLVFTVTSGTPVPVDVTVDYVINTAGTNATLDNDYLQPFGTVTMLAGYNSANITVDLVNDDLWEDVEYLALRLVLGSVAPVGVARVDITRDSAVGEILNDDLEPYLQIIGTPQVTEGETLEFDVRVGLEGGEVVVDIAEEFTVRVSTVAAPVDSCCTWATPSQDYTPVDPADLMLTFSPGGEMNVRVGVVTLDDEGSPEGEETEHVRLILSDPSPEAPQLHNERWKADGEILDDEATLSVVDVSVEEGDPPPGVPGDQLIFSLTLDRAISADVEVGYELIDDGLSTDKAQRGSGCSGGYPVDYEALDAIAPPDPPPHPVLTIRPNTVPSDPPEAVPLPVTICDDIWVEPNEDFWLSLQVVSGEAIVEDDGGARGTILNDDTPMITVLDQTAEEAPADGTLTFTVNLEVDGSAAQLSEEVSVEYVVEQQSPPSALEGVDYAASSGSALAGTLVFGPGTAVAQTVSVDLLEDYAREEDETFLLRLSDADTSDSWMLAEVVATGTITDDPPPVLSVDDFSGLEGTTQFFTVTLANPRSGKIVTVDYVISGDEVAANADTATAPGHATKPADFDPDTGDLTGTVTFDPATACQTSCTVEVRLLADHEPESGETLRLTLTNPSGAVLSGSGPGNSISQIHGVGTITDVLPPTLSVVGFTDREGTRRSFTVSLANPRSSETAEVHYAFAPGSPDPADAGDDYTAVSPATLAGDTLSFPPGTTEKSVTVDLVHDNDTERDEKLELQLSNAVRAHLPAGTAGVGTITDVIPPYLVVDDMSAHEGTDLVFTVTLCNPRAGDTVTVDYRTANREAAVQDGDFEHMSGTLEFVDSTPDVDPSDVSSVCGGDGVSAKSHTVRVKTLTDLIAENDERLHLVLSENPDAALNAVLEDRVGVGTIINSNAPVVRVSNARAKEGEMLTFVISLVDVDDNAADYVEEVIVTYQTADRGSAVAGEDYEPVTGMVTFPARGATTLGGFTTHDVAVTLRNDTEDEDDEIFALVAAVPARNASLGKAEGTGTIVDSPPPYMRIDDPAAVREGEEVRFTVSLNDENGLVSTNEIVTVKYLTRDGTATAREDDYEPELSGEITFQPGAMQQTLTINTLTDDDWELAEEFRVDLHTPENAILDKAVGTGTIRADCIERGDSEIPRLTVHGQEVDEGSHGNTWASLDRPLCFNFTVEWMLAAGTATAADFYSSTYFRPTTNTLNARVSTNERFSVYPFIIEDDDLDEEDEEFRELVRWESGMPARFLDNNPWIEAPSTILDNDPLPNVSIADAAAMAGDSMTFEVSLDAVSGREVTVDYYTVDVTAEGNGVDYSSVPAGVPRTVTIPAGQRSETFTVQTVANTPGEIDETFHVVLADASNARIDDGVAVGTILAHAGPSLIIADASADEDQTMNFSVTLSEAAPHLVTVDYAANVHSAGLNPATPGDDYVAVSDTLTFSIGQTQQNIPVDIEPDDIDEPDETFLVELSNQTAGVSLADAVAVGTINGNVECIDLTSPSAVNLPPIIGQVTGPSVSGYTDIAVREDSGEITLTLAFETPFCHGYPILYERLGGSAQRNVDYVMPGFGQAQMAPLDPDVDIVIPIVNDNFTEGDEDVELRLRGDTSGRFRKFMEPLTVLFDIVDDDVSHLELPDAGDTFTSEGGFLSFVVRLDKPTTERVEFYYETRGGPAPVATEDVDYEPTRGPAAIAAGELSVTIPVRTIEDSLFEHDENVELRLSNLTGAEPDPDGEVAVGRIVNDDDPPAVSVSNPFGDEGAALVFEVTLDTPAGREASLSYSTSNGSATAGDDYADTSGSLTFDAGETAKTVSVQSLTDGEFEGSEYFFLDLSSNVLRFDDNRGTGTIRDVTPRRVSVSDAVVDEGGVLNFVVGFNGPPASRDITVAYSTAAVTAGAGIDYSDAVESAPGVVRILAGRTSAVVGVQTLLDTLDEDLEQLRLVLSDPVGAVLVGAGEAVGTIIDDDPEPLLSVDDPEATENGDGTPITFTVSLSEVSGRDVEVSYSTVDSSAVAGDDYVAATSPVGSPLVIPRGARSVEVPVTLVDDDVEEVHERFLLELSDPVNAEFGDTVGAGTILDDDGLIEILLDTPDPVYEGPGATVDFVVRLSRADPVDPVTFGNYMVGGSAEPFGDYTPFAIPWTIDPGDTSLTIPVQLVDDDVVEDTESFLLGIGDASSNATISGKYYVATATILDDDALPELSVSDAPVATEGATAMFSVELSRSSTRPVTVEYAAVVDPFGGDAAAIPGQDFEAVTGTLTIPARGTSATVAVPLPDDALDEHTETFWLRLADPTGATVDDGTGIGMIDDDDPLPQLSVGDSGATEGGTIRFTVRLDTASGRTVTVPWTTAVSYTGDPASPTDDYVAASGTLTFASGTTSVTIDIATVDDEVSEPDETFQIQLGQPTNAAVDDGVAVGAIVDDDGLPRISIAGDELLETDSPAIFVVTLSRLSSQTVTVDYATTAVTATAATGIDKDYGPRSGEATGTLVIPAGLDTGEISVFVADDDIPEGTETFLVTLSNAVNAVIAEGAGTAVGTILDDDKTSIAIGAADAYEADGTIEFPVTLSAASTDPVTVRYTTFDGSATQPDDYLAASTTLTIPAGTTTATIAVTLTDDIFVEQVESFLLRLHNPTGAEIEAAEAVGVIFDDDDLPVISGTRTKILESDGSHTWRVMLSHPSNLEVTVDYEHRGWGGVCHGSSPASEGTFVFEPGSTTATVTVPVVDDDIPCLPIGDHYTRIAHLVTDEYLYFSNPVNAVLDASGYVIVDVHDDDGKTTVTIQSPNSGALAASESDGHMVVYVELGRALEVDVVVPIRIDETQALQDVIRPFTYNSYLSGPQATAGSDFVARNGVTVPAGEVLVEVLVQITDDDTAEETEFFAVVLPGLRYSSTGQVIGTHFHDYLVGSRPSRALIIDNDSVNVAAEDIEVLESAGTAVFRLHIDRENTQTVTVNYETVDGTAEQPGDYTLTSGTATFDAGTRTVFVSVPVVDDDEQDADETFDLRLTGASGASISHSSATATILDDDGDDNLRVIHIADAGVTEPSYFGSVNTRACFALTVNNFDPYGRVFVDFQPLEAPWLGDGAATPGDDYGPLGGVFEARTLEIHTPEFDVCVNVFNDDIPEPDEMFIGWFSNAVGAVLGNNMAWATIIDRDPPIASVIDVVASESDAAVEFTLSLHAPDIEPSSVDYTTVVLTSEGDRAARPGEDYTTVSDTLTFPAGATSATISVPIIHDTDDEADETFELVLSNPVNLEFLDGVAIGTIVDDDPGWVIDDRSVREDAGSMVFTVTRDHRDTSTVTVDYTVTGASAVGGADCVAGVDYITPPGSVTLLPAETQATISVTVCDDDVVEGSETLFIELTGVPGRKLTGIGTIFDNIGG